MFSLLVKFININIIKQNMDIKIKDTNDFSEYNHFESIWVDTILCHEILPRNNMIEILKNFNMKFFGDDWENKTSLEEIGRAIYGDVKKDKLLPYLQQYIKTNFSFLFSYDEAKKIYEALLNLDSEEEIMKIWLSMPDSNPYKEIIEEKLKEILTSQQGNEANKIITFEDKISRNSIFANMLEEIILSWYKLMRGSNKDSK